MTMKRIIIFNWMDIKNPNSGGQEKYCYEIGKRLARDGMKVYWVSSRFKNSMNREMIDNIEIIRVGSIYTVFFLSFIIYLIYWKDSYLFLSMNSIPFFVPYSRRRRLIMLHHRIDKRIMKEKAGILGNLSYLLQERIMPILFRNDHVITNSASSKMDFDSLGYRDITVVKLGVNIPDHLSLMKKKICVSPGPIKPWKHHDMIIRAFSNLSKDWELIIFGSFESDEFRALLENICDELNLNDRVHFLGRITDEKMLEVYELASICILGTEKEGWGFVAMEAQAFGCPVVAFDVPGIRDSVINGQTGILVSPGDVISMSKALAQLSSDEELLKIMSDNAIMNSRRYTWEESYKEFKSNLMILDKPRKGSS
jgi:glycosyltransferase involved in cell wall biosynthesis